MSESSNRRSRRRRIIELNSVPGSGAWAELGVEERGIANLARLAGNGDGRNTALAFRHGYADQPHLIREVQNLAGVTPARLHADRRAE